MKRTVEGFVITMLHHIKDSGILRADFIKNYDVNHKRNKLFFKPLRVSARTTSHLSVWVWHTAEPSSSQFGRYIPRDAFRQEQPAIPQPECGKPFLLKHVSGTLVNKKNAYVIVW